MKPILILLLTLTLLGCFSLWGCGQAAPVQPPAQDQPVPEPLPEPQPEPEPIPQPVPEPPSLPQTLLASMTVEEKVGQLLLARCPAEDAPRLAAEYRLGGYILFARDFQDKTPEEVTRSLSALQEAAPIPLLLGVDEEGGTVTRVSRFPALREEKFPSPQTLWSEGGMAAIEADTREKCALLSSLGINWNLAPVCDVSTDPADFIYPRTFGRGPEETARYVETVVTVMEEEGMASCLKHFPGYGSNADTHTGVAYDSRPYDTFLTVDFLPFAAGIEAEASAVLVSHNVVEAIDPTCPASLSPKVISVLREELGFEGVILTDDLVMEGVRSFSDEDQSALQAIQAGCDMALCSDFERQYPALLSAVEDGSLSMKEVDRHVLRILTLKEHLGLLQ